jgi:HAMP domain-containing protein
MLLHVVETVEPVLSYARECLTRGSSDEVGNALQACSVYLDLYRPPAYAEYSISTRLREQLHELADARHLFNVEPVHNSVGDRQQILECLAMLVQAAVLEDESMLVAEVFDVDQAPCIGLSFDGLGHFVQEIVFNDLLRVSLEELRARWTSATRGGRIDTAPNGLLLRLTGQRILPDVTNQYEALREAVDEAARLCQEGHEADTILAAVDKALDVIDGECTKSPTDLNALLAEMIQECKPKLTEHSIVIDTLLSAGLPPIVVHRKRVQAYIANLAAYAQHILPEGGAMMLLLDYDPTRRCVELTTNVSGKECRVGDRCTLASLRRTVVDVHGGAFEVEERPREVTITAELPDVAGRALDEWLPHSDVFSEKSKQVLRLLKSGGEALPEDLLLGGILEEELERWLLPKLSESPASNLAHELLADLKRHSRSTSDPLAKALDQVERGKPRREIAKPRYAAPLLRAYNASDRGRKALGLDGITQTEVEKLATALQSTPLDHAECLRIIARARRNAS